MPASAGELAQLKNFARAMVQLIEAIEARMKVEPEAEARDGAPAARFDRIPG